MATDPNKKTLRHFQCRDYLWETFEQLSGELECSVDYLINEAMRQYARSRQQGARSSAPPGAPMARETIATPAQPTVRPPAPAMPSMPSMPSMPAPPPRTPAIPAVPAMPPAAAVPSLGPKIPSLPGASARTAAATAGGPAPARPAVAPSLPSMRAPGVPTSAPRTAPSVAPATPSGPRVPGLPPMSPAGGAPPLRPAPPPSAPPPAAAPTLYAIYEGQQYPVNKDEFIIGRGQKTSDLCIRDSNVSRRHAVVVLHNSQFWMVDQQSTNGVEFQGAKIDRKRIEDGDVFKICDYEVTFVYR
jgi:hypothetical protein